MWWVAPRRMMRRLWGRRLASSSSISPRKRKEFSPESTSVGAEILWTAAGHVLTGGIRHFVPRLRVARKIGYECAKARLSVALLKRSSHRLHHSFLDVGEGFLANLGPVTGEMGQQGDGWRLGQHQCPNKFWVLDREEQDRERSVGVADDMNLAKVELANECGKVVRVNGC